MTLIKSISGIRGTIGGPTGENLTPLDIVKFTTAYTQWLKSTKTGAKLQVVVGRDARLSGDMVSRIITGTLVGCGVDVIDVGLCTTPGVELAVIGKHADGGIIITASHNPKQWNALKLLNCNGEFLNDSEGKTVLAIAQSDSLSYTDIDNIGHITHDADFNRQHIDMVLALPEVDVKAVSDKHYRVVVDAVNSVGGIVIPQLLKRMGVEVVELNCTPDGNFAHNPEPIPANLTEICAAVKANNADLGVVVDPDVDRLALVCEDGRMFGEEYTLVSVADYILSLKKGNTVSNMSSSRALKDVTVKHGGSYEASAVGEVNVVAKMKETGAVIGGEGNGGVIYPALHYGRDALVGVALFLTNLAKSGLKVSELKATYPDYFISKNRMNLTPDIDVDNVLAKMYERYKGEDVSNIDGVKINFATEWVHLRKSNTEPIIRIYSESRDEESAEALAQRIIKEINGLL